MMQISIFSALQEAMGDDLPVISLTKATLVHLSHTLEDFVLTRKIPALMFTGFQESSHWRKETARYREMAETAHQVCIFAGDSLPEDQAAGALQITLTGDDPLRQEWFLAIMSTDFSVVLCGLDNLTPVDREAHRLFDTVWSFDTHVVSGVLDVLEQVVEKYRPDVLPDLVAAREKFPLKPPEPEIIVTFVKELLRFQGKLQDTLIEQKQNLEISETLYRTIAYNVPVVLLVLDEEGNVMLVTGQHSNQVFPSKLPEIGSSIQDNLEHLPMMARAIRHMLEHGSVETTLYFTGDEAYDLRGNRIQRGELTGHYVCVLVDISDRIREQKLNLEKERLQVALEKERELNDLRKKLMITLSHELRTPLATIQTASDILKIYYERLTVEKREERLLSIQSQVQHLANLLDDIDTVVRSENQTFNPDPSQVDLYRLFDELVAELHDTHGHPVQLDLDERVKTITFDERWLRYVVRNLLSNAAKYSPDATPVHVQTAYVEQHLRLKISDQGIGISIADQKRLFEPFFRGSNVGAVNGTGLGLVIVQNIIHSHDGTIGIESQLGVGTTVTVHLPLDLNKT